MDSLVFAAVLAAAMMHGGWNVLVKLNLDRFLSLFLIQSVMGLAGMALIAAFPFPAAGSFPHVAASSVLHLGYNLFLARSYRTGDLSQVYPIARGSAPMMTLAASSLLLHEPVSAFGSAAVAILVAGILVIGLAGRSATRLDGMTLLFALGTSVFIAAYTIVDGVGGRASGSPAGYAGLLFVIDAMLLAGVAILTRGRGVAIAVLPFWRAGLAGGVLSAAAYAITIWAMSHAPISVVAALRETSILFVMVLSVWVLKEAVTGQRLAGALLIASGAVMLRFA